MSSIWSKQLDVVPSFLPLQLTVPPFLPCFLYRGLLTGDEEHVSGWDLIYDNGFIEIDPEQCGYTTFLGAAVPQPDGAAVGDELKK